jgi:hypothetical protein
VMLLMLLSTTIVICFFPVPATKPVKSGTPKMGSV